jgi:hypothetical protein
MKVNYTRLLPQNVTKPGGSFANRNANHCSIRFHNHRDEPGSYFSSGILSIDILPEQFCMSVNNRSL